VESGQDLACLTTRWKRAREMGWAGDGTTRRYWSRSHVLLVRVEQRGGMYDGKARRKNGDFSIY
jgi:hypothetical protein